jgi:DNA-nicking Smr family endonuclease
MRRLGPEEQRLWARVVESVRPIGRALPPPPTEADEADEADTAAALAPAAAPPPTPRARPRPGNTLDSRWDKSLARGLAAPDLVLDLHGHNLATAYDLLDRRLEQAIASGARLMLLVTGKPPRPDGRSKRGAIRAAVGDWLAASRHAGRIAAVRGAHKSHGGEGALYIVLRRPPQARMRSD